MVAMTLGSTAGPPSESSCSEVVIVSLCRHWRPSSALASDREAAIKLVGLVARGFSGAGSSVGRFHLSPAVCLSLALEGPTVARCG